MFFAWLMLIVSCLGCFACSCQAAWRVLSPEMGKTVANEVSRDYDDDDAEDGSL